MSAPTEHLLHELVETAHPKCDRSPDCHHPATHIARVHQLDCCNDESLTADGARIRLLCMTCLAALADAIKADLTKRIPKVGRIACLTCGRPVATLHDILETERI